MCVVVFIFFKGGQKYGPRTGFAGKYAIVVEETPMSPVDPANAHTTLDLVRICITFTTSLIGAP